MRILIWTVEIVLPTVEVVMIALLSGLGVGLGLIVAIGAQNAFVLRQGLRRDRVLLVVVLCALSDAVLIAAGVGGLGFVVDRAGWVLVVLRWAGAAFLLGYGLLAARRALRPGVMVAGQEAAPASLPAVAATCLALTWLNPHVYLDTVVLLGSVANTHGDQRWWFAAGAAIGSVLWFTTLGFGARLLAPVFAWPAAWRVLDGAVAVVMVVLAVGLVLKS